MWTLSPLGLLLLLLVPNISQAEIVLKTGPVDSVVALGQPWLFPCQAEDQANPGGGQTDLLVQWRHNDSLVDTLAGSRLLQFQNGSLYISQTQEGDQGSYTCTASLPAQPATPPVTSLPATLYFAFIEAVFYHPEPVSVVEGAGAAAHFQCVSGDSRPLAQVYWERDGATLTSELTSQDIFGDSDTSLKISAALEIQNPAKAHQGNYRCMTFNPLLPDQLVRSDYAALTVEAMSGPPYVSLQPSSVVAPLGAEASLRCIIAGTPDPDQAWFRDSPTSSPLTNTSGGGGGTLQVLEGGQRLYWPAVQLSDQATYYCLGNNSQATVQANPAALTVATIDLAFVESPGNTAAVEGQEVTLRCRPPASSPPANITWFKDNQVLVLGDDHTVQATGDLYIGEVEESDAGNYFCTATNQFSIPQTVSSETAFLEVYVKATITERPADTAVVETHDLTLAFKVKGHPAPAITWTRNNMLLTEASAERVTFLDGGQTLHVTDVIVTDKGVYTLFAQNTVGSDVGQVTVNVIIPPQIYQGLPASLEAVLGAAAFLPCQASGDPSPTYSWQHDGAPLDPATSSRLTATTQGLQINGLLLGDAGLYTCTATNQGGSHHSSGTLHVQVPPTITTSPANLTVAQGSKVTLTCTASGDPAPEYLWTHDGDPLPPEASVTSDLTAGSLLTFESVESQHSGLYSCTASNPLGSQSASATLSVQVEPWVEPWVEPLPDLQLVRGAQLVVTCQAGGQPPPLLTWRFQGAPLQPDGVKVSTNHQSLLVLDLAPSDQGEYGCVATNEVGQAVENFQVTVIDAPASPSPGTTPPAVTSDPPGASTASVTSVQPTPVGTTSTPFHRPSPSTAATPQTEDHPDTTTPSPTPTTPSASASITTSSTVSVEVAVTVAPPTHTGGSAVSTVAPPTHTGGSAVSTSNMSAPSQSSTAASQSTTAAIGAGGGGGSGLFILGIPQEDMATFVGVVSVVGLVLLATLAFSIWYCRRQRNRSSEAYLLNSDSEKTSISKSQEGINNFAVSTPNKEKGEKLLRRDANFVLSSKNISTGLTPKQTPKRGAAAAPPKAVPKRSAPPPPPLREVNMSVTSIEDNEASALRSILFTPNSSLAGPAPGPPSDASYDLAFSPPGTTPHPQAQGGRPPHHYSTPSSVSSTSSLHAPAASKGHHPLTPLSPPGQSGEDDPSDAEIEDLYAKVNMAKKKKAQRQSPTLNPELFVSPSSNGRPASSSNRKSPLSPDELIYH